MWLWDVNSMEEKGEQWKHHLFLKAMTPTVSGWIRLMPRAVKRPQDQRTVVEVMFNLAPSPRCYGWIIHRGGRLGSWGWVSGNQRHVLRSGAVLLHACMQVVSLLYRHFPVSKYWAHTKGCWEAQFPDSCETLWKQLEFHTAHLLRICAAASGVRRPLIQSKVKAISGWCWNKGPSQVGRTKLRICWFNDGDWRSSNIFLYAYSHVDLYLWTLHYTDIVGIFFPLAFDFLDVCKGVRLTVITPFLWLLGVEAIKRTKNESWGIPYWWNC